MAKWDCVLQEFGDSLTRAAEYPLNLVRFGSNHGALKAHRKLLDQNSAILFKEKSKVVTIDVHPETQKAISRVLTSDSDLIAWLGLNEIPHTGAMHDAESLYETSPADDDCSSKKANPFAESSSSLARALSTSYELQARTSPSVRCRFVFFQAANSQARLDVSRDMATKIFTFFQVIPNYISFISVFATQVGQQVEPTDLRFSGFRSRILLSTEAVVGRVVPPHLGLSGQGYQICFNLKSVCLKIATGPRTIWQWSPRQAVFHHQFDLQCGTSLWIMTAARTELQERIQELLSGSHEGNITAYRNIQNSFIASLSVSCMLAQWASEDWAGYIRWLEEILEEKTIDVMCSSSFVPSADDITFVQKKQDDTNKAIIMLTSNAEILQSVIQFYTDLIDSPDFPLGKIAHCRRAVSDLLVELRDFKHDFEMVANRARILGKITKDRKELVLQHLQAHATARMENMNLAAQRETSTMRVIAVVTLIYLPATFVSTLFSTDIVHYDEGAEESYSPLALQRWFTVTVPLTIVTFVVALGWLAKDRIVRYLIARRELDHQEESDAEKAQHSVCTSDI